jgi:hypothetical protein
MNQLLENLSDKGRVSASDVLQLRREVFGDSLVDQSEARTLMALAEAAPDGDTEWHQFYCEIMGDLFARQKEPRGYVTEEDAAFLIETMGSPEQVNELKLAGLVHLLKVAVCVPKSLTDYGFATVRAHVLADGRICAREVEHLRTFLFAAGGHGNIAVTREEAELLFDINDATRYGDNAPAWIDLFMKAIANYLMAHVGYTPPSRHEALRQSEWLNTEHKIDLAGFFSRMFSGGLSAISESYSRDCAYEQKNRERDAAIAVAEEVTSCEAEWLATRIGLDGQYDDAERALIEHIKTLADDLPPALKQFA